MLTLVMRSSASPAERKRNTEINIAVCVDVYAPLLAFCRWSVGANRGVIRTIDGYGYEIVYGFKDRSCLFVFVLGMGKLLRLEWVSVALQNHLNMSEDKTIVTFWMGVSNIIESFEHVRGYLKIVTFWMGLSNITESFEHVRRCFKNCYILNRSQ